MRKLVLSLFAVLLCAFQLSAQRLQITGTVTGDDGAPVAGATVSVVGTMTGTSTDARGVYTINAPADATLEFSFLGLETQQVPVGNRTTINIVMHQDATAIDDIVVVGYGTMRRADLSGAISSIGADDLNLPVADVAQALQGKVSGLQIVNTSGRTGESTIQMSMRGNGSLRASSQPLYVIDGIPSSTMAGVAPSEIESISVLKDAASAAIYGSRASNGVILITTKTGKFSQPTVVEFAAWAGIQKPVKKPKMLNAEQYTLIQNESLNNYQADINAGILAPPTGTGYLNPFVPEGADTDWLGEVMRSQSYVQNYQIGVSGGNDKTRFYLGSTFYDQQGVIKNDHYKKATLRLNLDHNLSSRVRFGIKGYTALTNSVPLDEDNSVYSPWSSAMNARPDIAPFDTDGSLNEPSGFRNPYYGLERMITDKHTRLGGTGYVNIKIIDGLDLNSNVGGDIDMRRYRRYDAPDTFRGKNGGEEVGYGMHRTGYIVNWIVENTLNYTNNIDRLKYTILVGNAYQRNRDEDFYAYGENFPSSQLSWIGSSGLQTQAYADMTRNAMSSVFGRLQLGWENRYNLMFSIRGDGSSKFLPENRWGTFFAVAGSWNLHNEQFFNSGVVSTARLRLSYGETGNQDGISNTVGQNLLGTGQNYYGNPGLYTGSLFNENLTWEVGRSTNLGIDLGFLDDRLEFSVNLYNKKTDDLLYSKMVASETGFMAMLDNVGNMRNRGIEIELNANIINTNDFRWDFGVNFSYNKNKILKLSEAGEVTSTGFVNAIREGGSLGDFYLLESLGVAQEDYTYYDQNGNATKVVQAGDMIYRDVNGDGIIDDDDMVFKKGGIAPIFGGMNMSFRYKNFDLQIIGQYSFGKKLYIMSWETQLSGADTGGPYYSANMIKKQLDRWTPNNPSKSVPRAHASAAISQWNNDRSTRFLSNADYFRFSDITLGYTFNFKGNFVQNLRVYLQGRNLFTITNYEGSDPEVQYINPSYATDSYYQKQTAGVDTNGIPNMKAFIFGVNFTF